MKKIFLLGFILMLMLLLVACGDKQESAEDDVTESVTTEQSDGQLAVEDGDRSASITAYKIVIPAKATEQERAAAQNLKSALKRKTGKDIIISDDWVKPGEDANPDTYEILLGLTAREASQAVRYEVRYDDYLIRNVGKKLVIFAHNLTTLQEAIGCFSANLKKVDNEFYWEKEYFYHVAYELDSVTLLGAPIYEYEVVVPKDPSEFEKLAAERITNIIATKCGYMLKNVTHSNKLPEKAIIVANHAGEKGGYVGKAEGTQLTLSANNSASFVALWNYFDTLLKGEKGVCVLDNKDLVFSQMANKSVFEMEKGADIRVISSNVLFSDKGTLDTKNRMRCLAESYLTYLPDVIGLQEARPTEMEHLMTYLNELYAKVSFTASDGHNVYQQILYRKDLFTLKDKGFTRFRNNVIPWGVSWAVLERKSDGKLFALTNMHATVMADTYDPGKNNATDGVEHRVANCQTVLQTIDSIRAKYPNIPIMSTGDWNSKDGAPSMAPMNASALMKNALTHATVRADTQTSSAHSIESMPTDAGNTIDHIFFTQDVVTALVHDVIANEVVIMGSDHCPVYVDFQFKS